MRLKLKSTVLPFYLVDQVVLQFNSQYYKIPDPTGKISELTRGLDGTRSLDVLLSDVTTGCTEDEATTISRIARDFVEHRLVESVDHNIPVSLTLNDQQRFSRNIDFFGSMTQATENKFSYQEKLRDAKVCVLGCGGLGTHILFDLAATGVHHLTIVDFDKIELSNLNRQILYREADVGADKVTTAKARLLDFNSELKIEAHSKRIESPADIEALVKGHDVVICVADKPANYIAEWLNIACVTQSIPFVTGGLDTRRSVFYSVIPGVTGCVHCWMAAARKHNPLFETISIASKRDDITYAAPAPAFVTLVAVTAGMMISEAVKIITQCQPPQLTNKLKEFTFDDLSTAVAETWARRPDCEVCAAY
ncbi:HesA/MoeB/ThiF family protein [Caballeronia cordobensis]|uniref:HesA/MoeB/ThiF family protein n=1 Tax=Caballeronia cordobensis TaxID=1353886 RepID=UPI00045EEC74|nr:putative membrane protein [Burkholderia sp. RPE67]